MDDTSTEAHDGGVAVAKLLRGHDQDVCTGGVAFRRALRQVTREVGAEQVRQYLLHLLNDKGDAWSTLQVNRAALKFLYGKVLKQPWFDEEITKPKKRPRLPTVLSPEEITRMLDRTSNLKHWTVLATFYATGLRSRELRLLKVSDIEGHKRRSRRLVL